MTRAMEMGVPFVASTPDLVTLLAAALLLIGMPLFVVLVLALLTGYISHDATAYLEGMSDEELEAMAAEGETARAGETNGDAETDTDRL